MRHASVLYYSPFDIDHADTPYTFGGVLELQAQAYILKGNISGLDKLQKESLSKMVQLKALSGFLDKLKPADAITISIPDAVVFKIATSSTGVVEFVDHPEDLAEFMQVRYQVKASLTKLKKVVVVNDNLNTVELTGRLMTIGRKSVEFKA